MFIKDLEASGLYINSSMIERMMIFECTSGGAEPPMYKYVVKAFLKDRPFEGVSIFGSNSKDACTKYIQSENHFNPEALSMEELCMAHSYYEAKCTAEYMEENYAKEIKSLHMCSEDILKTAYYIREKMSNLGRCDGETEVSLIEEYFARKVG